MAKLKDFIVGEKEVRMGVEKGIVKKIIFASNCPDFIKSKFENVNIEKEIFNGDEEELGTYLGRAFPIAIVGVKNENNS